MLRDCEAPVTFHGDRYLAVGVYSSGTAEDMLTKGFDEVWMGCIQYSGDGMATSLSVWIDGGLVWVGRKRKGRRRGGQGRASKREGPKFLKWPRQGPRNFFSGVGPHCRHCEWSMSLGSSVMVLYLPTLLPMEGTYMPTYAHCSGGGTSKTAVG